MQKRLKRISVIAMLFLMAGLVIACQKKVVPEYIEPEKPTNVFGDMVSIDGIDVSGMTHEAAQELLAYEHKQALSDTKITVNTPEKGSVQFDAASLPIQFNVEEVIDQAADVGTMPEDEDNGEAIALTSKLSYDSKEAEAIIADLTNRLNTQPKNATVIYDPYVEGKFKFTESEPGYFVDVEKLNTEMEAAMNTQTFNTLRSIDINAIMVKQEAEYTLEMAQNEHMLVSSYTTYFKGESLGNEARVFNITKGAGILDGIVVAKGAEFDINEVLGPRTPETGWQDAMGIIHGRYQPDPGGGICQVSSTLYDAILMADLTISERQHHSWPMAYVPIGLDATISTGGPNLKFINDSSAPITISTEVDIEQTSITISIYGAPLEGAAEIKLRSELIEEIPEPEVEYELDAELPYSTTEEKREGRIGKRAISYKDYLDENGEIIKTELVQRDLYRPHSRIIALSEDLYYSGNFNISDTSR